MSFLLLIIKNWGSIISQENAKHTKAGQLRGIWVYGRNMKGIDHKRMVI